RSVQSPQIRDTGGAPDRSHGPPVDVVEGFVRLSFDRTPDVARGALAHLDGPRADPRQRLTVLPQKLCHATDAEALLGAGQSKIGSNETAPGPIEGTPEPLGQRG